MLIEVSFYYKSYTLLYICIKKKDVSAIDWMTLQAVRAGLRSGKARVNGISNQVML